MISGSVSFINTACFLQSKARHTDIKKAGSFRTPAFWTVEYVPEGKASAFLTHSVVKSAQKPKPYTFFLLFFHGPKLTNNKFVYDNQRLFRGNVF